MNWRIFRATIVMCVIVPLSMFLLPLLGQPIEGPVDSRGVLEVESADTRMEIDAEFPERFLSATANADDPVPSTPFLSLIPGDPIRDAECLEYRSNLTVTVAGQSYVTQTGIMLCQASGDIDWPYKFGIVSQWRVPKEITGLPEDLNVAVSGNVRVYCPNELGDLNNDGTVTLEDFVAFAKCWGLSEYDHTHPTCSDPLQFSCADITGDGEIDLHDFSILAAIIQW